MNLHVQPLTPAEWALIAQNAHAAAFVRLDAGMRAPIDYALLLVDEWDQPRGYVTTQLHDPETAYWKFGGAMRPDQGSPGVRKGLLQLIAWEKLKGRKAIHAFIENTNVPMLKMALSVGFRVVGVRATSESLLLDHRLEVA